MDVLDLIQQDHRKVETIFTELESTDDTQTLYDRFNLLYQEINLHTEAEEQTFYPAISELPDTKKLVEEGKEEHHQAKQILEETASFSPTSKEFKQKLSELKQAIQHHVQEEENEVFPKVVASMSEAKRQQVGSQFAAIKSKLQNEISFAS